MKIYLHAIERFSTISDLSAPGFSERYIDRSFPIVFCWALILDFLAAWLMTSIVCCNNDVTYQYILAKG